MPINKADLSPEVRAYIDEIEEDRENLTKALNDATDVIEKMGDDDSDGGDDDTDLDDDEDETEEDDVTKGKGRKVTKSDDKPTGIEELLKADPVAAKEWADMKKALADSNKAAEEASKLAKAEQERREIGEVVTMVKAELDMLPVKADDFGPVLHRVSKAVSAEDYAAILKALKAGNAGVMFKELGTSTRPDADGADFETLVKAEMDTNKVDYITAATTVGRAHPDLYASRNKGA